MAPPPIRYPLPTLALVLLIGVIAWWGRGWISAIGATVRSGIERVAAGPPVPSSTEPKRRAGPIVRKVLLLRPGVGATTLPDGPPAETIGRRIFADIYDTWPLRGEPTHYRIGNRRPIGWVSAADVLPWDTRLVLIPSGTSLTLRDDLTADLGTAIAIADAPLPVIDWSDGAARVAVWEDGAEWERVARTGWVREGDPGSGTFGVLLSRAELVELLRRSVNPSPDDGWSLLIQSILGQAIDGGRLTDAQVREAMEALPGFTVRVEPDRAEVASDRLGRINDNWEADATWSGIEYTAIPLVELPGGG